MSLIKNYVSWVFIYPLIRENKSNIYQISKIIEDRYLKKHYLYLYGIKYHINEYIQLKINKNTEVKYPDPILWCSV